MRKLFGEKKIADVCAEEVALYAEAEEILQQGDNGISFVRN